MFKWLSQRMQNTKTLKQSIAPDIGFIHFKLAPKTNSDQQLSNIEDTTLMPLLN